MPSNMKLIVAPLRGKKKSYKSYLLHHHKRIRKLIHKAMISIIRCRSGNFLKITSHHSCLEEIQHKQNCKIVCSTSAPGKASSIERIKLLNANLLQSSKWLSVETLTTLKAFIHSSHKNLIYMLKKALSLLWARHIQLDFRKSNTKLLRENEIN